MTYWSGWPRPFPRVDLLALLVAGTISPLPGLRVREPSMHIAWSCELSCGLRVPSRSADPRRHYQPADEGVRKRMPRHAFDAGIMRGLFWFTVPIAFNQSPLRICNRVMECSQKTGPRSTALPVNISREVPTLSPAPSWPTASTHCCRPRLTPQACHQVS
jgi:hypothetical protein